MAMAEDAFIPRFLMAFEDIVDSLEGHIETRPYILDPTVSPLSMVRWVAKWVGFEISPSLPPGRQRRLIQAAGKVVRWRGTRRGLEELLEAFTDGDATVEDHGGVYRESEAPPRNVRVSVHLTEAGSLDDAQLVSLVRDQLPADALIELTVGDRRVEEADPDEESSE